jgi:hypothetical protein
MLKFSISEIYLSNPGVSCRAVLELPNQHILASRKAVSENSKSLKFVILSARRLYLFNDTVRI